MPRYPRTLSSSNFYHVMIRGNAKSIIFIDDEDRNYFLDTLARMKRGNRYKIHAYCLMNNHVHLLLEEQDDPLARAMKRINVSYVYYFNKKYNRVGHLFQGRFRSEAIEDDTYLLAAARYIHNNPVKAGIVKKPDKYQWSSYKDYITHDLQRDLINTELLLSLFSEDKMIAIKKLKEFTNITNNDRFIEVDDRDTNPQLVSKELQLPKQVASILAKHGQTIEGLSNCSKIERNILLRELKEETSGSVRQLAKILNISKDIIARS